MINLLKLLCDRVPYPDFVPIQPSKVRSFQIIFPNGSIFPKINSNPEINWPPAPITWWIFNSPFIDCDLAFSHWYWNRIESSPSNRTNESGPLYPYFLQLISLFTFQCQFMIICIDIEVFSTDWIQRVLGKFTKLVVSNLPFLGVIVDFNAFPLEIIRVR